MTMAFGIFFFLLKSECRRVKKVFFMNPGRLHLCLGDFRLVSLATLNRIILSSYCSFNFFLCSSSFILLKFQIPCFSYIVMRRCPGFEERVCKSKTSTSGDQSGTNLNLASAGAIRRHEDSSQSGTLSNNNGN